MKKIIFLSLSFFLLFSSAAFSDSMKLGNVSINFSEIDGYVDVTDKIDENTLKALNINNMKLLKRYDSTESTTTHEKYIHIMANNDFLKFNVQGKDLNNFLDIFYNAFGEEKKRIEERFKKNEKITKNLGMIISDPSILNITKHDNSVSVLMKATYKNASDPSKWYYSLTYNEQLYVCNTFFSVYSYDNFTDEDIESHILHVKKEASLVKDMLLKSNSSNYENTNEIYVERKEDNSIFGYIKKNSVNILFFAIAFGLLNFLIRKIRSRKNTDSAK